MLKKEVQNMYKQLSEQKKEAIETLEMMYTAEKENIEAELEALQVNFNSKDEEMKNEYNELMKRKDELEENFKKSLADLQDIQVKSNIKDNNRKINNVLDAMDYLKTKEENERVKEVISLLESSLSLNKLSDYKSKKSLKQLKKQYQDNANYIQGILANSENYVFPSIFQLKNSIFNILIEDPNIKEDKHVDAVYLSKAFVSNLCMYIKTLNIKTDGIYVYYLLNNIYEIENLPIDKQFELKKTIKDITLSLSMK